MTFNLEELEKSHAHFNGLLRKLTPSEKFHLYQFLITLLEYLLEMKGQQ